VANYKLDKLTTKEDINK